MSTVIYRKYRPTSFSDVIGQDTVVTILKESILSDNIAHAYLFSGPRGTGKTSVARILAQAVNCLEFQKGNDVCNKCEACMGIINGSSLDIIEMDAASNRGIDEIRSLRDSVQFMPNSLNKKVYIIDEAHMLTKDAFNALLKTLEEPPEHVLFILATTEAHKLPITILSRVQRHNFTLVDKEALQSKLSKIFKSEGVTVEDGVYDLLYNHSHGSFRDAESLVGKILSSTSSKKLTTDDVFSILGLVDESVIHDFVESLLMQDRSKALELLGTVGGDSVNVSVFVDQSLEYLRQLLLKQQGNSRIVISIIRELITAKQDQRYVHDKLLPVQVAVFNSTKEPVTRNQESESGISNQALRQAQGEERVKVEVGKKEKVKGNGGSEGKEQSSKNEKPSEWTREDVIEFIRESDDFGMIIKNQLLASTVTKKGNDIVVRCDKEVYDYFSNNGKHDKIENIFKKKFGVDSVIIESQESDISTGSDSRFEEHVDNSDIVEDLL